MKEIKSINNKIDFMWETKGLTWSKKAKICCLNNQYNCQIPSKNHWNREKMETNKIPIKKAIMLIN
jgi:hypothetical protein